MAGKNLNTSAGKRPTKKPAEPRAWKVSIIRARLTFLGTVYAPDRRAEDAAVEQFGLRDIDRRRMVIEEQP